MIKNSLLSGFILFLAACNNKPNTNNKIVTDSTSEDNSNVTVIDSFKTPGSKTNDGATETAENQLIIAGESIGKIKLGMSSSQLTAELGNADMSDAAMGKAWLTWYGKKPDEHNNVTELNVFITYKDTSMQVQTVQQVRTTSSFFRTENDLHVYSDLDTIQSKFAGLTKAATYTDSSGRNIIIYDARQQGIAFEITAQPQKICIGIIVHTTGIRVTQTYLSLHPDMHIF